MFIKDRLKDAEDRLKARVVTKFDVLRAQTDVANVRQTLIVARNTTKLRMAELNSAIGIQISSDLNVSEEDAILVPPKHVPSSSNEIDLDSEFKGYLKEAISHRPEVLEADAFIAAAKKGIDLAYRTERPSFNLSWSYLYAPNAGGTTPLYHTWQAQAVLSVPIFDGGVSRARRKEAQGGLDDAESAKRQAVDQVSLDTEQAYLKVEEASQRVAVAEQSFAQATEAFNLAKVRYKAGVSARSGISPLLELSDAQAALTQAQSNQVNALYDYNDAVAKLDRAVGRYSQE